MGRIARDFAARLSAEFGLFEGHERAARFGPEAEECRRVRQGAGFTDRSPRGRLVVAGAEAEQFLQRLLTNDVKSLAPGRGVRAGLLTPKGKFVSDLLVLRRGGGFLVETPPERREEVARRLSMYVLSSDVTIEDRTDGLALLSVCGPRAAEALGPLLAADLPDEPCSGREVSLSGAEVLVVRRDDLGVAGFDLHLPAEAAESAAAALLAAGVGPFGFAAEEILRVEAGTPRWGAEIDEDVLPPEVPWFVARAVSYTKGCYVGQETVGRIRSHGHVNRELRGLLVEGECVPAPGAEIVAEDRKVGRVTSACSSPLLGRPIALAFVGRAFLATGTPLTVVAGGPAAAKVVPPGEWGA